MRFTTLLVVCASALMAQNVRVLSGTGSIDAPGSYRLARDVMGGISINASDVTLDLNGYSVSGSGGLAGMGILVNAAQGVEVHNGSISNFGMGVVVQNSANVRLHGLRIRATGLAVTAPPPEVGIMIVQSANVVVEDNAIYNVGLGIFVRGGMSHGNRIVNNTVTAGTNGLLGICYNPAPGDMNGPRGDLVSGNLIEGFSGAVALSELSLRNVIANNTLIYREFAVQGPESNVRMNNIEVGMQ